MLEVRNLSKTYVNFSLQEVSFTVNDGDYFVLLGLSGAGKSLILELIAGLERPDAGNLFLDGKDITRERIQHRSIGVVFQDLALFPHMTVSANMQYPLRARKMKAPIRKALVAEVSEKLGIAGLLHRRPGGLSGGEQQRVALARVLMYQPSVLLLDEPLSSLDVQLREDLRSLLRNINREGRTVIHVTHDYDEAVSLANRIAVVQDGRVIQEGPPREVFGQPRSAFVARFAGMKNFYMIDNQATDRSNRKVLVLQGGTILPVQPASPPSPAVMIDSRKIRISRGMPEGQAESSLSAVVLEIFPSRDGTEVRLDAGIPVSVLLDPGDSALPSPGEKVFLSWPEEAVTFTRH